MRLVDSISLPGILVDAGIVSILIVGTAATDAAWKTYPLDYSLNPICPSVQSASASPTQSEASIETPR
jgi:hypothetical protein